jgi:hypothetical protein
VTSESRIAGVYRAKAPCVTITLALNQNHTFLQSAQTTSGETTQLAGTWSLDSKFQTVVLKPFLDFSDDTHGRKVTFGSYKPERWPRGILMGPIIVRCPESSDEIDYVK